MAIFQDKRTGNWVVKTRDHSGKQIAVTVNAKNAVKYGLKVSERFDTRAAIQLEQAVISKVKGTAGWVSAPLMLGEVVDRFLKSRLVCAQQMAQYRLVLKKYLVGFLGNRPISAISLNDIERLKIFLANGRSVVSLRDYLLETKIFFGWAAKTGLIAKSPVEGLKIPPRPRKPVYCLTPEQVNQLLQAVRGHFLEPVMVGLLNLGVRRGELINIEWSDVNFENNMVLVRGTKTAQSVREVPISEDFKQFLQRLPRTSRFVFTNKEGGKLSKWALASGLRRLKGKKGLDFYFNFHTLRKTYGSLLVRSGKVPIEYVSKFLGHSSIKITQEWYIGLRGSDYRDKVSSALQGLV